jgi:hypothetical protein
VTTATRDMSEPGLNDNADETERAARRAHDSQKCRHGVWLDYPCYRCGMKRRRLERTRAFLDKVLAELGVR